MHSRYPETPVRDAAPAAEAHPAPPKRALSAQKTHAPAPKALTGRDAGDILLLLVTLFLCLESEDDETLVLLALLLFAGL
ncbi:MAG: hypothetical protein LBK75_00400 [Oscillospiraceae bacterium]|jgi:hypothetical protein|nr:hypothetical protein [Oscillospiraceae bacterium]